jgi:hypothetical protein
VLAAPKDACGSEPPMPLHVVSGDVPDVIGLTPTVGTSVVPRRRPVGGTGAPGPMPSGDVMPSGEGAGVMPVPPTCAKAEPLKRAAAMVAITKRVIITFVHEELANMVSPLTFESRARTPEDKQMACQHH